MITLETRCHPLLLLAATWPHETKYLCFLRIWLIVSVFVTYCLQSTSTAPSSTSDSVQWWSSLVCLLVSIHWTFRQEAHTGRRMHVLSPLIKPELLLQGWKCDFSPEILQPNTTTQLTQFQSAEREWQQDAASVLSTFISGMQLRDNALWHTTSDQGSCLIAFYS